MAGHHNGLADLLRDHNLAQAAEADQDEVAGLGEKVRGERLLDDIASDARGLGPASIHWQSLWKGA